MARTILVCLIFISFVMPPQTARAAVFSGEYLMKICAIDKDGKEVVKGGKVACQSYISGVVDYHNMLRSMDLTSNMNFCIPEGVSLNELHSKVLGYLIRNKKLHRNFVAAPAVAMALFSAYPCGGKKSKK